MSGRRSREKSSKAVVLDTSYVLPFLGIDVKGISMDDILDISRNVELCFPMVLFAEVCGVMFKQARKQGLDNIPKDAKEGLESLATGIDVRILPPTSEDVEVAYQVIRSGWTDIFDAFAYASAATRGAILLTLDDSFKRFLKKHGFSHQLLKSHEELMQLMVGKER
ncbi:MAG: PIN domain-containing protein [Candidatus Baldrarchaeia archaeon]